MIEKISSIVLQTRKFGDSSKIAVLFSREHGKLSVLAKGAFNPKSKFVGSLQPGNQIEVQVYFKPNRELHTLSSAEISKNRHNIQKDNLLLGIFLVCSELISKTLREGEIYTELFDDFVLLLESLNRKDKPKEKSLEFIVKLIEQQGFAFPRQKVANGFNYFSFTKGAFFQTGRKEDFLDDITSISMMKLICKEEFDLQGSEYLKILNALIEYLSRHLDHEIKINSLYLLE